MSQLPDISNLSLEQLVELRAQIENRVNELTVQQKKEVMDQIMGLMQTANLTLDDLSTPSARKSKSKPKYRSPDGQEWTGKGRKPKWMVEQLEAGKSMDDFLI